MTRGDSRVDEADNLSPTLGSFSTASCYMEPTGLLPFLPALFPQFFCPIYSFPRLFLPPSPADFILVTYFQLCLPPHSIFLTKDRRWNSSVQCTVHAHCPSSLGTLREHSEKIQRSRRDQLETIRRLLRNHSENMKRRLRKCPFTGGAKPGPQTCFAFLNPQRKKSERYDERLRQFWNAWRWQGVVTALVCARLRPESRRGTPATTLASTSLKIMRQKFKKIGR